MKPIFGTGKATAELLELVKKVAPTDVSICIQGESGSGKEVLARQIHELSDRSRKAFVAVNCGAIPKDLLESELFGHIKGAFTGAIANREGKIAAADGGTLFLDELANTELSVQEKILRVIEYGEFERLGGSETLSVDVRIVAATNEDLPELARQNRFREDLLDRLAFDVITLPPLRERSEDILVLAEHFAVGMVKELGGERFSGFSDAVTASLLNYPWPGNIRELKNAIERAVYQNGEGVITNLVFNPFDSPYRLSAPGPERETGLAASADSLAALRPPEAGSFDFKSTVKNFEIALLRRALEQNQFNQKKAAETLSLSYHQLRGYLRKYDLLG
mgnify:CR=1 FL=1